VGDHDDVKEALMVRDKDEFVETAQMLESLNLGAGAASVEDEPGPQAHQGRDVMAVVDPREYCDRDADDRGVKD
jgi:hypothetical protein